MEKVFSKLNVARKFILTFALIMFFTVASMIYFFIRLNNADNKIDYFISSPLVSISSQLK